MSGTDRDSHQRCKNNTNAQIEMRSWNEYEYGEEKEEKKGYAEGEEMGDVWGETRDRKTYQIAEGETTSSTSTYDLFSSR